jgi:hypothetical protein
MLLDQTPGAQPKSMRVIMLAAHVVDMSRSLLTCTGRVQV